MEDFYKLCLIVLKILNCCFVVKYMSVIIHLTNDFNNYVTDPRTYTMGTGSSREEIIIKIFWKETEVSLPTSSEAQHNWERRQIGSPYVVKQTDNM